MTKLQLLTTLSNNVRLYKDNQALRKGKELLVEFNSPNPVEFIFESFYTLAFNVFFGKQYKRNHILKGDRK